MFLTPSSERDHQWRNQLIVIIQDVGEFWIKAREESSFEGGNSTIAMTRVFKWALTDTGFIREYVPSGGKFFSNGTAWITDISVDETLGIRKECLVYPFGDLGKVASRLYAEVRSRVLVAAKINEYTQREIEQAIQKAMQEEKSLLNGGVYPSFLTSELSLFEFELIKCGVKVLKELSTVRKSGVSGVRWDRKHSDWIVKITDSSSTGNGEGTITTIRFSSTVHGDSLALALAIGRQRWEEIKNSMDVEEVLDLVYMRTQIDNELVRESVKLLMFDPTVRISLTDSQKPMLTIAAIRQARILTEISRKTILIPIASSDSISENLLESSSSQEAPFSPVEGSISSQHPYITIPEGGSIDLRSLVSDTCFIIGNTREAFLGFDGDKPVTCYN